MAKAFKLSVDVQGLSEIEEIALEISQKAEELQHAIQRLNEVEIVLQSQLADK